MLRVGLISDTHGILRPEAGAFLRGCDHILHAGDIGTHDVLQRLSEIAPITAVRGNNDQGSWADRLAQTEVVQFGEVLLYLIHDLAQLDIEPSTARIRVVVSGHSHQPHIQERDDILYVNPGSAGPRRFKLPIAVGELIMLANSITPRIVTLGA